MTGGGVWVRHPRPAWVEDPAGQPEGRFQEVCDSIEGQGWGLLPLSKLQKHGFLVWAEKREETMFYALYIFKFLFLVCF